MEQSATGWSQQLRQMRGLSAEGQRLAARLYGRTLEVTFSPAAMTAAAALTSPLTVELELYFSCLVRKAVRFHAALPAAEDSPDSHTRVLDQVHLQFSPVTTQHCSMESQSGAPPLERMPLTKPQSFLPHWVNIDYRHGKWLGEYGW
jgi:hypothetical protein